MSAGFFSSAIQLMKVECILQPMDEFPYIKNLNMIYDMYPSPNRRLTILCHILMFYVYCEDNPKRMMHYTKLYLDQDINDSTKKQQLSVSK